MVPACDPPGLVHWNLNFVCVIFHYIMFYHFKNFNPKCCQDSLVTGEKQSKQLDLKPPNLTLNLGVEAFVLCKAYSLSFIFPKSL